MIPDNFIRRIVSLPAFITMGVLLGLVATFGGDTRYHLIRRALRETAENLEAYS